jgi:hypothetical protein
MDNDLTPDEFEDGLSEAEDEYSTEEEESDEEEEDAI